MDERRLNFRRPKAFHVHKPSLPMQKIEYITRFLDAWKVFMVLYLSLEFFDVKDFLTRRATFFPNFIDGRVAHPFPEKEISPKASTVERKPKI
jgi:hypothetical protein